MFNNGLEISAWAIYLGLGSIFYPKQKERLWTCLGLMFLNGPGVILCLYCDIFYAGKNLII
jgi:hypothetical protein